MGQRLVILNTIDGEDVNVLYYHWGAYTDSALSIVGMLRDSIVEEFNKLPKDMDRKTRFNIACMRSASGVSSNHNESYEYISKYLTKSEIEDKLRGSRNEGLIAFTEADRDDLLGWSEGTVPIEWKFDEDGNIDVGNTTFSIMMLLFLYTKEQWFEYFEDYAKETWPALEAEPLTIYDLEDIPIENAESYRDEIPDEWYDPKFPGEPRIFQKIY